MSTNTYSMDINGKEIFYTTAFYQNQIVDLIIQAEEVLTVEEFSQMIERIKRVVNRNEYW